MQTIGLSFALLLFFLTISAAIAAGVWLIVPAYAYPVAGGLAILSALGTLFEFFRYTRSHDTGATS